MYLRTVTLPLLLLLFRGSQASPLPQTDPDTDTDTLNVTSRISTPFHGADVCGDSTFEGATSSASPKVSDCLTMIDNISHSDDSPAPDGGIKIWTVENFIKKQHQLIQYGTCAFGIQGGKSGDLNFDIGNQDIIDVVKDSVKMFGGSGQVGAKGQMKCRGMAAFPVKATWGIYHTK